MALEFRTRKVVKSEDLNTNGTLFGGRLLSWIDEEVCIFSGYEMRSKTLMTKSMGKIDFQNVAEFRDAIEFGMEIVKIGLTRLTIRCVVRELFNHKIIATVDDIVCVCIDAMASLRAMP